MPAAPSNTWSRCWLRVRARRTVYGPRWHGTAARGRDVASSFYPGKAAELAARLRRNGSWCADTLLTSLRQPRRRSGADSDPGCATSAPDSAGWARGAAV